MSRQSASAALVIEIRPNAPDTSSSKSCERRNIRSIVPEMSITHSAPALIDIGINLGHESFDSDRESVIERARAAGVMQMIITGASAAGSEQALELARRTSLQHFATAGVHPHHASELKCRRAGADRKSRARSTGGGDRGVRLDYFRDLSPAPRTAARLHLQLELAARLGKPVFLHERDAHDDFVAIVREHRHSLVGGIAHCFTGTGAQLQRYLELELASGLRGGCVMSDAARICAADARDSGRGAPP